MHLMLSLTPYPARLHPLVRIILFRSISGSRKNDRKHTIYGASAKDRTPSAEMIYVGVVDIVRLFFRRLLVRVKYVISTVWNMDFHSFP